MDRDAAETVALKALGWLVAHEELLPVFLGASGASLNDLRARAGDPDFLRSVLEFVTMDDAWVMAFADATGEAPEAALAARRALPGGEETHWT